MIVLSLLSWGCHEDFTGEMHAGKLVWWSFLTNIGDGRKGLDAVCEVELLVEDDLQQLTFYQLMQLACPVKLGGDNYGGQRAYL